MSEFTRMTPEEMFEGLPPQVRWCRLYQKLFTHDPYTEIMQTISFFGDNEGNFWMKFDCVEFKLITPATGATAADLHSQLRSQEFDYKGRFSR